MRDPLLSPAEAYAPDENRAGPDASARSPEWLARWLAFLILCLLDPVNAVRLLRSGRMPSWFHERPDLPAGSTQAEAASIRGPFGNAIAWMCLRRGFGPGHANWPELSRTIVAFGGSLEHFRAGDPPWGLQWWENPNVVPGTIGLTAATPAATAMAVLLARQAVANAPPPAPNAEAAEAAHALLPAAWLRAAWLPASWLQGFVRLGTGPPTGPPATWARCPGPPTLSHLTQSHLTHGARAWLAPLY
jgi:hypothetical protein